jgi:anti-sigma factor RsiW
MSITPELLAAYADGELDAGQARAVEAEIAADADLPAQLAAHRALRNRLAAHFAPIAEQPVPERLRQMLAGGNSGSAGEANVIDFAAAAAKRRKPTSFPTWARIAGPALAASLVLALVGFGLRPPVTYAGRDYASGDLASALDSQLAATGKADAPVRVLLSFRDGQGEYCRGFTGAARSGIACRDDRGWRLRKLPGGASGATTEFRQAGSPDMAVMAAIQDMASGPALDAAEEQTAIRQRWRAR